MRGINIGCAGAPRNLIQGNTIAHSGEDGIYDYPDYRFGVAFTPDGHQGNAIRGNAIFGNGGLGINIVPPPFSPTEPSATPTPNDSCDTDAGGNRLQNFPQIMDAITDGVGMTTIDGFLDSRPDETFEIELFSSDAGDPSGFGEGQTWLATVAVATDSFCLASFNVVLPFVVPDGSVVTATTTDLAGNTSEFSAGLAVVCTDSDGDGVCDASDICPGFDDNVDTDGDGVADGCDLCQGDDAAGDSDDDGVCGDTDNCPTDANAAQADLDADGLGDACDPDDDGDGVDDGVDNCPADANADKADLNLDGQGDVCDPDDDGDGVDDAIDNCPTDANTDQADLDSDGLGDVCDLCLGALGTGPVASARASVDFLAGLMDAYHDRFPVYDDVSSAGNHFPFFGVTASDVSAVLVDGSWTDNPHTGATAVRCELVDIPGANWGGFYFMNGVLPDGALAPLPNWGTEPEAGITIPEATALTFWARGENGGEQIELFMGGVGHPGQPFPDSSPKHPADGLNAVLTTEWQQFSIPLAGVDLSYVLGGFGWVTNDFNNPGGAVFYLDDIQYELTAAGQMARLDEPRFIQSYKTLPLQPDPTDPNTDDDIDFVFRNLAFTYDNALALLAFLADGSSDGLRRARLLGDAFVYASLNDRFFDDGRMRTAYAAGDLVLPPGWTPNGRTGTAAIPGFFDEATGEFFEVEQGDVDVGNNSWAMTALLALFDRTGETAYLDTARRIGNFIRTCRNDSGTFQGFQGGIDDPEASPTRNAWASGEHNLDVYAAFSLMAELTGEASWLADATHAQIFVEALWDPVLGCYVAGTIDPETRNEVFDQLPLDIQTWSVLSLPDVLMLHPGVLDCIETNHRTLHGGVAGYDFNTDQDGVWFEGTAQAAVAYLEAGRPDLAAPIQEELRCAQATPPFGDDSGLFAATLDGVTTGFDFKYFQRFHIATASWSVFAQLGFNPYYQLPATDLAISKTDGQTEATPGEALTYTLTVSNAGPSVAVAASVVDVFPAAFTGVSWTCDEAGGGFCTSASGSGDIGEIVVLPVGASVTFTATGMVDASASGSLTNSTQVAALGGAVDPVPADNTATDVDVLMSSADLSITKTDGQSEAVLGGAVTYTVTVSNAGPSDAVGASVVDVFPAVLSGVSWTCDAAGGGTCGNAAGSGDINETVSLPAGTSVSFTATGGVDPGATGTLGNTATVAAPAGTPDPSAANNSATDSDILVASADLSITKTDGQSEAVPGGAVTYTVTVSNAGPSDAVGASVVDVFPAVLSGVSWTCDASGGGTCGNAAGSGDINETVSLPAGTSVTFTATGSVDPGATGTLDNTATVAVPAGITDPSAANNNTTDSDTLMSSADLSITKTDGQSEAVPGGAVTYTVTVSNAGPSDTVGASVVDVFPAVLSGVSWTCDTSGGGTCGNAAGSGDINETVSLPAGTSVSFTATGGVDPGATGTLGNNATVAAPAGTTDPSAANNSATDSDTLVASADLSITKTDGQSEAVPGGAVTYTVTVLNAGPSDAVGASVVDVFPAVLRGVSWTCDASGGGTCGNAAGSGDINETVSLPAGTSATFTATGSVDPGATGTLDNTATVAALAGTTDPSAANNNATDSDTLMSYADLSITKTDGQSETVPGGVVTYTVTVSNAGPSDALGALVVDVFPAVLSGVDWTCDAAGGGTCGNAAGIGDINETVSLPSGKSVSFTATGSVDPGATGTLNNTAIVAVPAGTTDPSAANNSATDSDTLVSSAELAVTKTDGQSEAVPGGAVTYTVTVSNAGPSDAVGASVVDAFPAVLSGVSWTCNASGGGTCGNAAGSGNINETLILPVGTSVTFTATGAIEPGATGTLDNTAAVAPPAGTTDPSPASNSATDSDILSPEADLRITKSNGRDEVGPGQLVTWLIVVTNDGPSDVIDATITDAFPATVSQVSWTCDEAGGICASASGNGDISETVTLPVGASVSFTVTGTVDSGATGLVNTATVAAPAGTSDPALANNSATDSDIVTPLLFGDGFESGDTSAWSSAASKTETIRLDEHHLPGVN